MQKIKLAFVGALAALLLSSGQPNMDRIAAASSPTTGLTIISNDGYYIERKTQDKTEFYVRIVKYNSLEELQKEYAKNDGPPIPKSKHIVAFSIWNSFGTSCTIHMLDPMIKYEPQYIGHEFVHCMLGDFHPSQPKKDP